MKIALQANWPDFVFEENYKLPTLQEVESHIIKNGHLENIPSAATVKEDGFFLGDMDARLLQKIEELTLYTIQQEKKITSQEIIIQQQEVQKLKTLADRLIKIEALLGLKK